MHHFKDLMFREWLYGDTPSSELPRGEFRPVRDFCTMEGRDMKTFINLLKDEAGASAAEYALILAIVGTGIAVAAFLLGGAITGAMDDARSCIDGASAGGC